MATTTSPNYGTTGAVVSGTWTSETNAWDTSPTTFASSTNVTATYEIDVGGYDFASLIPAGSTINSVSVTTWHYCGNVSRWNAPNVRAYDNTTALGTAVVSLTESTTTTNSQTVTLTGSFTDTQVRSSTFKIRFSHQRTSATGSTLTNLGAISVVVDYTPPVIAPVASFTASQTTINELESVTFTDTSTNTPTSWAWNFGTGASPATASTQGPHSVTYSIPGTSTVTLTATNSAGSDAADPINITVNDVPGPVASFTASTTTVTQGGEVTFTDTSTGNPTTYAWDFGIGATPATGNAVGPYVVTYDTVGTSQVDLFVSTAYGNDTDTKFITVEAPTSPQAEIWNGTSWVTATGGGAVAPTYIGVESGFTPASQTNMDVTKPTSAQVGDIVIVQIVSSALSTVITKPTEFTEIVPFTGNVDYAFMIGYRVIQSGDTSWTWTAAAGTYMTYSAVVLRGQSATPISDFDVQTGTATQLTTTTNATTESMLVTFAALDGSSAYTWTIDVGTERLDETVGTEFLAHAVYTEAVSSGTLNRVVVEGGTVQELSAVSIAVAGTGGGSGVEIWNGTSWRTDCEIWNGTQWVLL